MAEHILQMVVILFAITFIANIIFCVIELHSFLKAKAQKTRLEVDELLHRKKVEKWESFP